MSQNRQRVRIAVDLTQRGTLLDSIVGGIPSLVRNSDTQFELGFFLNGVPLDITQWQTVGVTLLPVAGNQPLILQSFTGQNGLLPEGGSAWSNTLSPTAWAAGTAQHVVVVASNAQMALAMTESPQLFQISITSSSSVVPEYVPSGQVYSSGTWSIILPAGTYTWTKGANDTSVSGAGFSTLTSTGNFTIASATTVTLNGSGSSAITATLVNTVTYTPSQSVGNGIVNVVDLGLNKPQPPAGSSTIFLTQAQADARYLQSSVYSSLNLSSALSLLNSLNTQVGTLTTTVNGLGTTYATKASPTFTGKVTLAASTNSLAALVIPAGTVLTSPVSGSIEYDGTNLYVTNNVPTRLTVASTAYVTTALTGYAALAGATFTGAVNISGSNIDLKLSWTTTLPSTHTNASAITLGYANATYLALAGGTMTGGINLPQAQSTGNITSSGVSPASSQYWVATAIQALVASDSTAQSSITVNTIKLLSAAVNNSTNFYQTVLLLSGGTLTGDLKLGYTTTLLSGNTTASATSVGYVAANYVPLASGSTITVSAPLNLTGAVAFTAAPTSTASYSSPSSTWLATVGWANGAFSTIASPTFTGLVTLATSTNTVAALKIPAGVVLTSPVSGVIEYDGTHLYFTNSTPTRLTVSSQSLLSGSGTPSGGTGANGDNYLNTANGVWFNKSSGSWSAIYTPNAGYVLTTGGSEISGAGITIPTQGSPVNVGMAMKSQILFEATVGTCLRYENSTANANWWQQSLVGDNGNMSYLISQNGQSPFFQITCNGGTFRQGTISFFGDISMSNQNWCLKDESNVLVFRNGGYTGTIMMSIANTGVFMALNGINIGTNRVIDNSNNYYDSSNRRILAAQQTLSLSGGTSALSGWTDSTAQGDLQNVIDHLRDHGLFA